MFEKSTGKQTDRLVDGINRFRIGRSIDQSVDSKLNTS